MGHVFNLSHNSSNLGFMNTTDEIARSATATSPFPENILWDFAESDQKRLRHWSDMFIRPGGVKLGDARISGLPITASDTDIDVPKLKLEFSALLAEVLIGAPVRIDVKLTNSSEAPILAPKDFGLKSSCISGLSKDPSGRIRSFRHLVHCFDSLNTAILRAGESLTSSMTILRSAEGALLSLQWCLRDHPASTLGYRFQLRLQMRSSHRVR